MIDNLHQEQDLTAISNAIAKQHCPDTPEPTRTWSRLKGKPERIAMRLHYQSITSTMIMSQHWPREAIGDKIMVFTASKQTQGVGQGTNSWISPPGNIYMTILLEYPINKLKEVTIRTVAAVGTVLNRHSRISPQISWINDLYLENKKVSGVLVRAELIDSKAFIEIGIGINVNTAPTSESTALKQYCNSPHLEELTLELIATVVAGLQSVPYLHQLEFYRSHLRYLHQPVIIYDNTLTKMIATGRFEGVCELGYAQILTNEGLRFFSNGRMRSQAQFINMGVSEMMDQL